MTGSFSTIMPLFRSVKLRVTRCYLVISFHGKSVKVHFSDYTYLKKNFQSKFLDIKLEIGVSTSSKEIRQLLPVRPLTTT